MIKVEFRNAIDAKAINKYKEKVKKAAIKMENLEATGSQFLGWKDLPNRYDGVEFNKVKKIAKHLIRENVEVLVVIGIGGSFAGAKAAIDMIRGRSGNKHTDKSLEVIFAGESLSSTDLAQKLDYVKDKNFAINVISKSGTTTEPAIAFRLFRKLLEEKVGINNASDFIVATTDENRGALLKVAKENAYHLLTIPDNVGGRFSVLTSVGLFPMACAGINIKEVMRGAQIATKKYSSDFLLENDAYKYAVVRFMLSRNYPVELMVQYEPQMSAFNEWWKQLAGESEGKNGKGVFPASAIFSTDLHSLGQFIQEGSKMLFETVITFEKPNIDLILFDDEKNIDNLNYLTSKSIHEVNKVAFNATRDAHVKVGKVPNIHIEVTKMNEENLGQLIIFFERAVAMTAYLMGVNPFNQPGVEIYKQNMFKELGKPTN